jgi:hypothetical protein
MSFVRPELVERLRPWRETAIWGGVLMLGLLLLARGIASGGLLVGTIGLIVAASGAGLTLATLRRMRLAGQAPDEGVVMIREARIGYFGPRGGGFLDLDGLERVEMATDGQRQHWELAAEGGKTLRIPVGASGAEGLYDALAAFARLDEDALKAALASRRAARFPIWTRSDPVPADPATRRRLH